MYTNRSRYQDLTVFGVCVIVDDDVTQLLGVVETEINSDGDNILESYLLSHTNTDVSPQLMARTKQTARKTDAKGVIPATTTGTTPSQNPPLQSPGGQSLATFPRRSRRFLDSDSELEQAANLFGMNFGSPARSTRSKSPASSRGKSPAHSTPGSSPARGRPKGSPAKGVPSQGNRGRGRGGSTPGRTATPVGVTPQNEPKPSTSGAKPGQAGYVNRGGVRGSSRCSPAYKLPSFSSSEEKEGDDEDNDDNDDEDDEEEDMEVDFPNLDQHKPQVKPKRKIAVKQINLIKAPKRGPGGFTEIARWNATARQGTNNETKRGWMKRVVRDNPRVRQDRPGFKVLQEIRFYQKSTCFLIPMRAFQRAVRQVALDEALGGKEYRWQARALFALQQAAEAYMVAYLCDANLLAIHARCTTIMDKDLVLVRRM